MAAPIRALRSCRWAGETRRSPRNSLGGAGYQLPSKAVPAAAQTGVQQGTKMLPRVGADTPKPGELARRWGWLQLQPPPG